MYNKLLTALFIQLYILFYVVCLFDILNFKFDNILTLHSYILFFRNSDEISFSYLGFYGQPTNHKRIAINVVYEAKANPKDHKADASADAVFSLGK